MKGLLLALAACIMPAAIAKECKPKENLANDASLRIGVKYKPETCTTESKRTKRGDSLRIGYIGTLYSDSSVFDESYYEGFEFILGEGHVIKGWDNGLVGMCVFEQRKLTIPAGLAYGESPKCDFCNPTPVH